MVLTNEQLAHEIAINAMVDFKTHVHLTDGFSKRKPTYHEAYNHVYTQTLQELESNQKKSNATHE